MVHFLANKCVLLGITGSIAAYKSADLVRRLRERGAFVRVAMSENAKRFITPLTMQAVSGFPVHEELFDVQAEAAMGHIELARWADVVVIAPATADFMAKLSGGEADDLLTTLCLATNAPIAIAPAMNQAMWKHAATQSNLAQLKQKGYHILGPTEGSQACGDMGPGRMLEPLEIIEKLNTIFKTGALAGLRVLVTAGPTHEHIDPIRFISNGSSGKMGYAVAAAAREAGANVTLVSGPTTIAKPQHIECINVITAQEMYDAVMNSAPHCDIFISVAAVTDFKSTEIAKTKIHKDKMQLTLNLSLNPDIVATVAKLSPKPFVVGFAAETEDQVAQAEAKRTNKRLDMIIANKITKEIGMGSEENEVTILGDDLEITLPRTLKRKLARQLIAIIAEQFKKR